MVKLIEGEKIALQGNFSLGVWCHLLYLVCTFSLLFPAIFWYMAYRQASGGELIITNKRVIGYAFKGMFSLSLVDVDIPLQDIMKVSDGAKNLKIKTLTGQDFNFRWIDDSREAANILKIKISEAR